MVLLLQEIGLVLRGNPLYRVSGSFDEGRHINVYLVEFSKNPGGRWSDSWEACDGGCCCTWSWLWISACVFPIGTSRFDSCWPSLG